MKENADNEYNVGDIYKCYNWKKESCGEKVKVGEFAGYMKVIAKLGEAIFISNVYSDLVPMLSGEYYPDGGVYNKYEFVNKPETYKHVLYTPSSKFVEGIKAYLPQ